MLVKSDFFKLLTVLWGTTTSKQSREKLKNLVRFLIQMHTRVFIWPPGDPNASG